MKSIGFAVVSVLGVGILVLGLESARRELVQVGPPPPPAVTLAQHLVSLTPAPLQHVFFADSGSVAVEVAIKMAIQYWYAQNRAQKHRLITIRGGYHGDTFGAMAVCDPVNGMHEKFQGVLPRHIFADRPVARFGDDPDAEEIQAFENLLRQHHEEVAAVILEPIVQGAGGMWFYSAEFLREIAGLCRQYDVLLIADEIATGFGRTGKMLACEHADIAPDILCLGKALTGGYVSLAATMTTQRVAHGISADHGVMMHGPTFMANPLAASIANASIELLLSSRWEQRVAAVEQQLREELLPLADHPNVVDVRVLGAIGVVEMRSPVDVAKVQSQFVSEGVWVRPFGNLIYLMPPYVINAEDLSTLTGAINNVL